MPNGESAATPNGHEAAIGFLKALKKQEHRPTLDRLRDEGLDRIVQAGSEAGYHFHREDLRKIAHAGSTALATWNDL